MEGKKTEPIIELHYQNLDVALHAKLALHNILVWEGGLFVFITVDYSQTGASSRKHNLP